MIDIYVIKNNRKLYIRLDEKGKAVTCSETQKGIFEYSKAKNILGSLNKNLKKLNFEVEFISDIPNPKNRINRSIKNSDYEISENISRWIEKFGTCADILDEAKKREKELITELYKFDDELLDILHVIEMEKPKDLYGGWLIYKKIRKNRKERRSIKDEIIIVEKVLNEMDSSCLQRERVKKAINGLFKRKYRFRIIEEDETKNTV